MRQPRRSRPSYRYRPWAGVIDRLEERRVPSMAGHAIIRTADASSTEFLDQVGKVSPAHPAAFDFTVYAASNITVDVSKLPRGDRVQLVGSNPNFVLYGAQAGGASFTETLQPGKYDVAVLGRKKAHFQISLYTAFVNASTTTSPGTGTGASGGGQSGSPNPGTGGSGTGGGTGTTTGGGTSTPTPISVSALLGTYVGTATSTIVEFNPLTGQTIASNPYQTPEVMVLGAPLVDLEDDRMESNPFDLVVTPPTANPALTGGVLFLKSAALLEPPSGPYLYQYWNLQLTSNGFTGALSQAGFADGIEQNFIEGPAPLVGDSPQFGSTITDYYFQDASNQARWQTTLTATLTGPNTLDVQIQGVASTLLSYESMVTVNFVAQRA